MHVEGVTRRGKMDAMRVRTKRHVIKGIPHRVVWDCSLITGVVTKLVFSKVRYAGSKIC